MDAIFYEELSINCRSKCRRRKKATHTKKKLKREKRRQVINKRKRGGGGGGEGIIYHAVLWGTVVLKSASKASEETKIIKRR